MVARGVWTEASNQEKKTRNFNPEGHSSALFLDFQVFSYRAPFTAQSAVIGYFKSRRPKDPELIHIVQSQFLMESFHDNFEVILLWILNGKENKEAVPFVLR